MSAAILCIARNEAPYTAEWLEYHFGLGFDHIYYISTDENPSPIKALLEKSRFISRIHFFHIADFRPGWQLRCYNIVFPLVKEDWILVLDLDEYLALNSFTSLDEHLESIDHQVSQVQYPWLNVISSQYEHNCALDILKTSAVHVSDHVKSMVRRENATSLGIHSHNVGHNNTILSSGRKVQNSPRHKFLFYEMTYSDQFPCILHFCSRGHFDLLNRTLDHQFFNIKCGDAERKKTVNYLTGIPNWSNIPNRCLLQKFFASLPVVNTEFAMPELQSKTDLTVLRDIFLEIINREIAFNPADENRAATDFEEQFQFNRKLISQDPASLCSIVDYLKHKTQLDYIQELRNRCILELGA